MVLPQTVSQPVISSSSARRVIARPFTMYGESRKKSVDASRSGVRVTPEAMTSKRPADRPGSSPEEVELLEADLEPKRLADGAHDIDVEPFELAGGGGHAERR